MVYTTFSLKHVACFAALLTATAAAPASAATLPIIDLGYELHQAIAYNDTGAYYNFSNVRYAAPPLGNQRFRAPIAPAQNRKTVQTGATARQCIQAYPGWILDDLGWIGQYLTGQNITLTQQEVDAANNSVTATSYPAQAASSTEDCLFLDVMVPKDIFQNGQQGKKGSAVMVWIYGGGYTFGSKTNVGNPAGLLDRSRTHGREGVIYVGINYRLGAFGWLAGPTFQEDGTANAGLYDQRFALEWVQKNIHLFGGDPDRVTVFGESAGGGSIMHQITAFAGNQGAPFSQAILQSPGFMPQTSNNQLDAQYQVFLDYANVTTLAELRALPAAALISANTQQVWHSVFGQFVYGPAVDGDFVPALPGKALLDGNYVKDVKVMLGHNLDEGLIFTDPLIQTDAEFDDHLREVLDEASPQVIDYISQTLYPPVYDGSQPYKDPIGRTALLTSELIFTCNTFFFDLAMKNKTYSYYFVIAPGLHADDTPYTYYDGTAASAAVVNTTAALALQDWLVTFAEDGAPKTPDVAGAPKFVMYGTNATVEELNAASITHVMDTVDNYRCDFWQKGLYA